MPFVLPDSGLQGCLFCGERPAFDLSALSLERFARGEQRAERFVV